ncbi:MAG: hypothetical protein IPN08_16905 [Bacteroidales bacterium]|nr:hypothetical protein [Bacteroidales bacterium]
MKPKLRVGIFIDSYLVPDWEYTIIENIRNSHYAEICLIVVNAVDRRSFRYKLKRLWRNRGRMIFAMYKRLDDYFYKPYCNPDAFKKRDIRPLLLNSTFIEVLPVETRYCDYFDDISIKEIENYSIDVFLRMGFRIMKGRVLNSARYGIWSYQHSDSMVARGRPAGYWEVFRNIPVTGSVLQILTEGLDDGLTLYRSYASTYKVSPRINRNHYFLKSSYFVSKKLKELYDIGGDAFFAKVNEENVTPHFFSGKLSKPPGNLISIFYAARQFYRAVRYLYLISFTREQWFLKFSFSDNRISTSLRKFSSIIPPSDRFWADPHLQYHDGTYYIFIEEFIYRKGLGHISVIEMNKDGLYKNPVPVLTRPYHLSFPFVFRHDEVFYMIPESHHNRTIELYRSTSFPYEWEFVMNLMENVYAIDTTLMFHQNKWWMFTTIIEDINFKAWDELFIFHSEALFSRVWWPHNANPVVSDVSRARQAGRTFRYNGVIYRPSQNCSGRYGFGLKLNRIDVLDESAYRESEVSSIEPNWDNKIRGIHSFAYDKNLTVVDSLRRIKKLPG